MTAVTTETPLKEVCDYVDFRDYFVEYHEEYRRCENGNILMDCPSCGTLKKTYSYIGNVFCHKCRTRWTMYDWLINVEGMDRETAVSILTGLAQPDRVHTPRGEKINHYEVKDEDVEYMNDYAYNAHLNLTEETRHWWYGRGVSDIAINKFQLGERKGWYTIPLRDDYGVTFGIKKRWQGTKEDSPHNTRYECARGSKVQYAPFVLRGSNDEVAVIVGGEIKGLVLWSYFQKHNIPWNVVTTAAGENPWLPHWNEYMKFQKIAIWTDRDEQGYKFANSIHSSFRSDCPNIFPLDSEAKSVDDYILEGQDPIKEIIRALGLRGIRKWR